MGSPSQKQWTKQRVFESPVWPVFAISTQVHIVIEEEDGDHGNIVDFIGKKIRENFACKIRDFKNASFFFIYCV
jgi:hypothetical protein